MVIFQVPNFEDALINQFQRINSIEIIKYSYTLITKESTGRI